MHTLLLQLPLLSCSEHGLTYFSESSNDILPWATWSDCHAWDSTLTELPVHIHSFCPHAQFSSSSGWTDTKYLPTRSPIFTFCSCTEQRDLFLSEKKKGTVSYKNSEEELQPVQRLCSATLTLQQCWRCLPAQDFPDTSLSQLARRKRPGGHRGRQDNHCLQTPTHRGSGKGSVLGLHLQDWTEERLLTSWHFSQSPWDLPEGLSPSGSGVCHHTDIVAHIPEILRQGDSWNKDNSVLQDTVQKGILCSYVIRKMQINQMIWVYILMETDNVLLFLPTYVPTGFFFCCCCSFLLTLLIFVFEPLTLILHSRVFLLRDTVMSLIPRTKTLLSVKCLLPFQTTRKQEWEKVVFYLNYLTTVHKKELLKGL